jgi:hypothetical protein
VVYRSSDRVAFSTIIVINAFFMARTLETFLPLSLFLTSIYIAHQTDALIAAIPEHGLTSRFVIILRFVHGWSDTKLS